MTSAIERAGERLKSASSITSRRHTRWPQRRAPIGRDRGEFEELKRLAGSADQ